MLGAPLHEQQSLLTRILAALALLAATAACDATLGLTLPGERALEDGAANGLTKAKSFELKGSYSTGDGRSWELDLQFAPPRRHVMVTGVGTTVEAIVDGNAAYYRGQAFLASHMGTDPLSQNLVKAAGNAWWKGPTGNLPEMKDFTDGPSFRATFLGSANTRRSDHQSVDGQPAVELSGTRADIFIAATPPYRLLRVRLKKDVVVDSLASADVRYSNFDRDFRITAPSSPNVIDFSNLSTLPPVYTVVAVDTSGCSSPCVVSATLKNLGGATGATGPSTVTFTLSGAVSGSVLGTCQALVVPDVGYNATTTASCTINVTSPVENAAIVTAKVNNPGRG